MIGYTFLLGFPGPRRFHVGKTLVSMTVLFGLVNSWCQLPYLFPLIGGSGTPPPPSRAPRDQRLIKSIATLIRLQATKPRALAVLSRSPVCISRAGSVPSVQSVPVLVAALLSFDPPASFHLIGLSEHHTEGTASCILLPMPSPAHAPPSQDWRRGSGGGLLPTEENPLKFVSCC